MQRVDIFIRSRTVAKYKLDMDGIRKRPKKVYEMVARMRHCNIVFQGKTDILGKFRASSMVLIKKLSKGEDLRRLRKTKKIYGNKSTGHKQI